MEQVMFITTTELVNRTGLSKTTIWRYRKRYPAFPRPISIGHNNNFLRWVAEEVDAWLLSHRGA
jgi:predicted DNA-binding transcriptional regulator AlpA